jgi:competence protein ComEC
MKRVLPAALAAFIAGIVVSEQIDAPVVLLMGIIAICLGAAVFLSRLRYRLLLLLVALGGLGALLYHLSMHRLPADHILLRIDPLQTSIVTGVVCSFPENRGDRVSALLVVRTVDGVKSSGIVRVTVYAEDSQPNGQGYPDGLQYGELIEVRGRFRAPRNYRNPGAFDYAGFLARKGVRVVGSVSESRVRLLARDRGNPFVHRVFETRRAFHSFIDFRLGAFRGALVKALVTGDRSAIDGASRDRFARAGAAHLLAVSGLHVGFVALVCYVSLVWGLQWALPQRVLLASRVWTMPDRLASAATLIFIVYYTLFVGARTASVRAALMIGVHLMARIMERGRDGMHGVVLAAFLILAWRPASLFDVDFLLSFGAVTAMVLYYRSAAPPDTASPIPVKHPLPDADAALVPPKKWWQSAQTAGRGLSRGLGELAVMTLLATAATAPISAAVFHRVSMVGLVTNLLFVPLTAFWIVPTGLLAYLLHLAWAPLAVPLLHFAGTGAGLLVTGVAWSGALPASSIEVAPPEPVVTALFYGGLVFLLVNAHLRTSRRLTGIGLLLLFFIGTSAWSGRWQADGRLHMGFLDVGQGGATLLVLPDATTVLIDGGGSYRTSANIGKRVVRPTLLSLGIRRIDVMILTHPHPDHLNGLIGLLEEMPVGEVWDAWEAFPSEAYGEFRRLIAERGIPRKFVIPSAEPIRIGSVGFQVLHRGDGHCAGSNAEVNNDSLMLRVAFGEISLLLTGDLEAKGEQHTLKRWGEKIRSTVLQVPHHGAATSSTETFLDAVQPKVAVISVGLNNRFRHPSPKVVGRLRYIRPETLLRRTDRNGSVWLRTDGHVLQVLSDLF